MRTLKLLRAPIYWAHRAVVFAITRLSCFVPGSIERSLSVRLLYPPVVVQVYGYDFVGIVAVSGVTKALSTLSQISATVGENGEKTATVAEFGDSRTFLRQCGQGLRDANGGTASGPCSRCSGC